MGFRALVALCVCLGTGIMVAVPPGTAAAQDWGLTRERSPGASTSRSSRRSDTGTRGRPRSAEPATPGDGIARRIARYERVLRDEPADEFAFRRLVELYRERDGQADALEAALRARVQQDAQDWVARTQLGMLLELRGELPAAQALFREAAAVGRSPAPHLALMRAAERASDWGEAYAQGQAALALTRASTDARRLRRQLGTLAVRSGAFAEARRHFDAVVQNRTQARVAFAEALMEAGRPREAVSALREVTEGARGRRDAHHLRMLARAMVDARETVELEATLRRALDSARSPSDREETIAVSLELLRGAGMLSSVPLVLEGERSVGALRAVALAHAELGDTDAATGAFERWVRASPRAPEPRQRFAEWLLRLGDVTAALAQYEALGKLGRPSSPVLSAWIGLLVDSGRRADAVAVLERLERRLGRDPQGLRLLIGQYRALGEDSKAAPLLRRLSALDPNAPLLIVELGQQFADAGDLHRAISTWRRLTDVVEPKARGWARFGQTLLDADSASEGSASADPLRQQAQDAFEQALALEPDNLEWVRGLATSLQRRGDFMGAEQQWTRVLGEAGTEAFRREARNQLVTLWTTTRRTLTKVTELRRQLASEPPDLGAGRLLIVLLGRMGPEHRPELVAVLKRMAERLPNDVPVHRALVRFHMAQGDRAAAVPVYERLVELDPLRAEDYLAQLSELSLALYDDEAALRYAKRAVQRNPKDASAHRRLGDLYLARQMRVEAASAYRRSTQLEPARVEALLALSDLELSLGQHAEAKSTLAEGLERAQDDADTQAVLQRLLAVHVATGDFRALEARLVPLAVSGARRTHYRKTLVELYLAWVMHAPDGLTQAAVPSLLQALLDDDPTQRQTALSILERTRGLKVQQALLAFVASNAPVRERARALAVLSPMVRAQDVAALARVATEGHRRLRPLAVYALGQAPQEAAVAALRALFDLASGAPREIRAMAFVASGALLQSARTLSPGLYEKVVTALLAAFDHETTPAGRAAATWALGALIAAGDGDETRLAHFITRAGSSDWPANEVAARALMRRDPDPANLAEFLSVALFGADPAAAPVQFVLGLRGADPHGAALSEAAAPRPAPPALTSTAVGRAQGGQDMASFVVGLSRAASLTPWDLNHVDVDEAKVASLMREALFGPREQGARVLSVLKAAGQRGLWRRLGGALAGALIDLARAAGEPLGADALFVVARDFPEALSDPPAAVGVGSVCEGLIARAEGTVSDSSGLSPFERPWFVSHYRGSSWSTRRVCAIALSRTVQQMLDSEPDAVLGSVPALLEALTRDEDMALVSAPYDALRQALEARGIRIPGE